jgi:outer membrane receptor protein involved in Fe transport
MTFTKTNFSSYNVQIRGIGTQAISATTDPGVAVSFNDVGLIHNRLFEQEFFDVQSVEVLRGPQGTLYGRNATGGVINVVSAKPKLDRFEGMIKGEVGNYDSKRLVGMLNVPVLDERLALRLAGSLTKRDGYDYNSVTQNRINGRDLWSLRTTVGFEPVSWLHGNAIWERFNENDDRSRTGKQLCHRDASPEMIGSTPTANPPGTGALLMRAEEPRKALFSTGCKAGSLYDDDAFGTPNGLALNYIAGINLVNSIYNLGYTPEGDPGWLLQHVDPYGGAMQSRDLREVASFKDPRYRAKSDILELNFDVDVTPSLTVSSQTAYSWDGVYSFQDFNRFNTQPIFNDTSQFNSTKRGTTPSIFRSLAPNGVFCDPQLGCSNTLGVFDISSAASHQFTQELRVQSSYEGRFNFSAGANYTHFKTQDDYYVMSNLFTALAMIKPFNESGNQTECAYLSFMGLFGARGTAPIKNSYCSYIDPNPVESIDGEGHNYFRSSNPYGLESWAAFGEAYYNVTPDVKLTGGLRYTRDRKVFTPVPTQLLLSPTLLAGGYVGTGYPADPDIKQVWGEWTGRFVADWSPQLSFTDQTLIYASFSHGYKAGGANPPSPGFATGEDLLKAGVFTEDDVESWSGTVPVLQLTGVEYGKTFKPEYVNAFEAGTKNVLMDGRLVLNADAFYYDYKDYQVSQIRDRTAVNENFNARLWGSEMSARFELFSNFRLNANIGYLNTRIADGEKSIDPINRNLGNPDYTVVKPWPQLPSNCVVPTHIAEAWLQNSGGLQYAWTICGGLHGLIGTLFGTTVTDPKTGQLYDPANYPEVNGGAGLRTDLSGNELPNSPHWTVNFGAEYSIPFADEWAATVRTDLYWQAQSWWRVYNLDSFDRLKPWSNVNFTVRVDGPEGLAIEAYVKNAFDNTALTGAFLNSDDTGLTTNVFTTDPRLIGFSITKTF